MKKVIKTEENVHELNTIGERIRAERTKREMSQDELAKVMYTTREQINRIENNNRIISIDMLSQLSDLFNVSTDYLLCKTVSKSSENSNISKLFGLTDDAIEILKYFNKINDKLPLARTLDLLLTNPEAKFFFTFCTVYLFGKNQKIHVELPIENQAFCGISFNSEEMMIKEIENILKKLKEGKGGNIHGSKRTGKREKIQNNCGC